MTGSRTWGALRPIAIRFTLLAIFAAALVGALVAIPQTATAGVTYEVNSLGDDDDAVAGSGGCDTGADVVINSVTVDECTLRAAITEANVSGANTITFNPKVFNPGIIVVDPAGVGCDLTVDLLPQIEVSLTIDATGADVTLDGAGACPVGLTVSYSTPGLNFSLIGDGSNFTIEGFSGGFPITAGVLVCGGDFFAGLFAACFGTTLDSISIDGVTIRDSEYGVGVLGPNINNLTITNNDISTPAFATDGSGGVAAIGVAIFGASGGIDGIDGTNLIEFLFAELDLGDLSGALTELFDDVIGVGALSDSEIIIGGSEGNGNSLSGGISGVLGTFSGVLGSAIDVTVSHNDELAGESGPGVTLAYCGDADEVSQINFDVS